MIRLRTDLRPGDLGAIVEMHGRLYAREHGFDVTFEAYVAGPLAEFALKASPRERLWIAERDDRIAEGGGGIADGGGGIAGCIAIVEASPGVAQLRWFLVDPAARGSGLGRKLVAEAVAFSRAQGFGSIVLWTVAGLEAAARLYREAGFACVERSPGRHWGADVVEEKCELVL